MCNDKTTKKKEDLRTLKQILILLKPYKKQLLLVTLCFLLATIVGFFEPLTISRITDFGMIKKNLPVIVWFTLLLVFLVILGQVIGLVQAYLFADIHNSVQFDLSVRGFNKLFWMKVSYFSDKNSAEVIDNMKMDISNVSSIVDQSFELTISYIFRVVSGIAGLLIINWKLTVIVIFMVPIKYIVVSLIAKMIEKLTEEQLETFSSFTSWFSDNINGIKEIKLWGLWYNRRKVFEEKQKKILNISRKQTMLNAWNIFSESVIEWVIIGTLYVLGGIQIINGSMTIGGVFAFVSYSSYVTGPILAILNLRFMISYILPSARRLFLFLDLEEEDTCGNFEVDAPVEIEYKNVSFSYNAEKVILDDINLKISKGEKIAIIGSNGSGKTTFLNLLLRFSEPQGGCITIGGKNIEEINLIEYRKMFAVVSQDPYLFFGTVKENINLDGNASDTLFKEACQKSGADTFISQMPDKENSMIGRNGSRLSGGEKKRLAVARAIIKDSPYVILDEATSEFDVEFDAYFHNYLLNELKDRTLIMITHSYHQLKGMNCVYRIENGILHEVAVSEL